MDGAGEGRIILVEEIVVVENARDVRNCALHPSKHERMILVRFTLRRDDQLPQNLKVKMHPFEAVGAESKTFVMLVPNGRWTRTHGQCPRY